MIRHWQVNNFKSIEQGMGCLEFAPITLFAGANSSGKSTVIQSILLMMQTIAGRSGNSLLLNGELLSMGTIRDTWHNGLFASENGPIYLQYDIEIDDSRSEASRLWFRFVFAPSDETKVQLIWAEYSRNFKDEVSGITVEFQNNIYHVVDVDPSLERDIGNELMQQGFELSQSVRDATGEMEGLFLNTVALQGKRLRADLNWDLALLNPYDNRIGEEPLAERIPEDYIKVLIKIAKKLNLPNFTEPAPHGKVRLLVKTFGEYRDWFGNLPSRLANDLQDNLGQLLKEILVTEYVPCRIPFLETVRSTFETFFLQDIRYLSANRLAPTIIFPLDVSSQWSEVGINGANVASALQEHGSRVVRWYDPFGLTKRDSELNQAVATWLKFFGIIENVSVEQQGKLGTMLKIRLNGVNQDLDLTSVGFGTSQIMPIIVQGLLTAPGGIFIVEQPEVHLHPSIQSNLALFFVALSRAGVQCIIETHSEHLVNQLRLFIADRKMNLRDQIRIYFAERDSKTGTYFSEVQLDKKGQIANWPKGFMDESDRQAKDMLKAILRDEE